VGGDKWAISFTCLATRSVDSCIDLPRLYETEFQEGRVEVGKGTRERVEQGDCQLDVARRLQDGIRCCDMYTSIPSC
jgi:hypothetical protein